MYQKHCSFVKKKTTLDFKISMRTPLVPLGTLEYFDFESQKTFIPSTPKNRALVSKTIQSTTSITEFFVVGKMSVILVGFVILVGQILAKRD